MNEKTIEKRNRAILLLDAYEGLLTPVQKKIADAYYRFDLSLGEIATEESISRAAVSDCVSKAIAKLEEVENALGLVGQRERYKTRLAEIKAIGNEKEKIEAYEKFGEDIINGI